MKGLLQFSLCCVLASSALAQHHGGGGGGGHVGSGGNHGFGNHGFGNHGFGNHRFGQHGFGYGRHFAPWYYGAYWPWLGDAGWADSQPSEYYDNPGPAAYYAPPIQQPSYPVIIEQHIHPVIREYRKPEDYGLPSDQDRVPENSPVLYLLAFNDHAIRPATAYWVEDGTLHYLDLDHNEKQIPVDSLDLNFSVQLNRERHVPFGL